MLDVIVTTAFVLFLIFIMSGYHKNRMLQIQEEDKKRKS